MKLTPEQISTLIKLTVTTNSDPLDCDGCLALIDQYAQAELDGIELPEAIESVRIHLEQCKCCKDEYKALMTALREIR